MHSSRTEQTTLGEIAQWKIGSRLNRGFSTTPFHSSATNPSPSSCQTSEAKAPLIRLMTSKMTRISWRFQVCQLCNWLSLTRWSMSRTTNTSKTSTSNRSTATSSNSSASSRRLKTRSQSRVIFSSSTKMQTREQMTAHSTPRRTRHRRRTRTTRQQKWMSWRKSAKIMMIASTWTRLAISKTSLLAKCKYHRRIHIRIRALLKNSRN